MERSYLVISLFIFVFIGIGFIILLKKNAKKERIYKPKGPYLLSRGETVFFDALIKAIPSDLYVCPKVRLADLIEVALPKDDPNFWKHFNQISQKHVDFVLCNRSDFSPRLIVELDGGSHNDTTRSTRDMFVDDAFTQANIPIAHIKTSSVYDTELIASQLESAITDQVLTLDQAE